MRRRNDELRLQKTGFRAAEDAGHESLGTLFLALVPYVIVVRGIRAGTRTKIFLLLRLWGHLQDGLYFGSVAKQAKQIKFWPSSIVLHEIINKCDYGRMNE
ncbi:hypothetical protein CDAR_448201 [Caerostris darwini]|uniref:Uncharacterized protein n=1 Tax=Caerostris darwini TaxID=1538125 RepID=A0AAV4SD45_9ARAC|nr:hypothetical protein CDAR_448201 [Caerostris darwini]